MSIPPRPWLVSSQCDGVAGEWFCAGIEDATGEDVIKTDAGVYPPDFETAHLIVRLVNAEPEIVAALEAAESDLLHEYGCDWGSVKLVRAALAKLALVSVSYTEWRVPDGVGDYVSIEVSPDTYEKLLAMGIGVRKR